jgi:DNA-binding NarL/FixJ family response regulator
MSIARSKIGPLSVCFSEDLVAGLVARGLQNKHIAERLGISESTVKKYIANIMSEFGFKNRVQLALAYHNLPIERI